MSNDKDNDFKKMFSGLGISKSVTISKPKRGLKVGIVFIIFIIISSALVFAFNKNARSFGSLDSVIGKDTPLYIYLRLEHKFQIFGKLFFWEPKCIEQNLCTAYKSSNIISWDGFDFEKDLSGELYGYIEIAKTRSGGAVFSSRLRNPKKWIESIDSITGSKAFSDGNLVSGTLPKGCDGVLADMSKSAETADSSFVWAVSGDNLYIATDKNILREIFSPKDDTLGSYLVSGPGKTYAMIYVLDPELAFGKPSFFADLFSSYESYPLIVYASYEDTPDGHGYVFRSSKNVFSKNSDLPFPDEKLDKKMGKIKFFYNNFASDYAFYFNNPSFLAYFNDKAQNAKILSGSLGELYGIDIYSELKDAGDSGQVGLFLSKNEEYYEWMIVSDFIEFDFFKQLGLQMFAISHPLHAEKTLQDGSTMVELVAETEGLSWSDYKFEYNGKINDFLSLQGQGEPEIYITGEVEGFGAFLTNSEEFLNRAKIFMLGNAQNTSENDLYICGFSEEKGSSVRFGADFLLNIPNRELFLPDKAGQIFVFDSKEQGFCGYME